MISSVGIPPFPSLHKYENGLVFNCTLPEGASFNESLQWCPAAMATVSNCSKTFLLPLAWETFLSYGFLKRALDPPLVQVCLLP